MMNWCRKELAINAGASQKASRLTLLKLGMALGMTLGRQACLVTTCLALLAHTASTKAVASGINAATQDLINASSSSSVIAVPVSAFSTYPSSLVVRQCEENTLTESAAENSACQEDIIAPDTFIDALRESSFFSSLHPYEEKSDYQLLIANVSNENAHLAEITLQWRSMEIASHVLQVNVPKISQNGKAHYAAELVAQWRDLAIKQNLFSASYLYQALDASNYERELVVPQTVGEFKKLDTQLYADPFSGAITRYVHPTYEEALLDIIVYPFTHKLSKENNLLLNEQLKADLEKTGEIAKAQELTLTLANPAAPYKSKGEENGWRLGIAAQSEKSPTLYATTYVFRKHDKIIKIATTFPADFSDPLVDELMQNVDVPKESVLMRSIRELL
ncbi:hypothetical protein [Alteromonas sp. MB-3u-76]|uniref:hypothetical protein n=1 Tax=Alteromonas sp. MB-3u-76 TaxID=2058133 RepID=UPI0012FDA23D|nr:hypothetical protein [Alteromonas sp. MB-3u-76]